MEVAAFHPPPFDGGRLVSVALFLAFALAARPRLLRPGVTRHPALWSPDFPLPAELALRRQRRSGRLRSRHCRGFAPAAPAFRPRCHLCRMAPRRGPRGGACLCARCAQSPACGSRCGIARGHPAGCVAIGLARRSTRDGRRARSRSPCPAPLPWTDQCPLERCDPEPRRFHSRGSACDSRSRIARRRVTGSRSRRLRRSRRKAGGATREPWVGDRSRTGTRATTRVRRRSLGREPVTLRPTRMQVRMQVRRQVRGGRCAGWRA